MKKLIFALVCAAALSSCGKKSDDAPQPVKRDTVSKLMVISPDKVRHY